MRKGTNGALWTVCTMSLALAVGCGGDDPAEKEAEPEAAEEALLLDCMDVEGQPEDWPHPEELYDPAAIKEMLEQNEALREAYGADEVTDCEEAREFVAAYKEVEQDIVEQYAEENPGVSEDEAEDISEEAGEAEPVEDESVKDDATPTEDVEVPQGEEAASADMQKVYHGIQSTYSPPMYKIVFTDGGHCTATAINDRWLITAAHCITTNGYHLLDVQQQKANGTTSKTLFGGAIWFEGFRLNWGGTWNYGNDIALLKVYSSSSSQRFAPDPNPLAAYARIWLGSTTATNCGACATPYNSRQTIYGYGMTFQADDSLWALHWGWVKAVSNYWNYWYSQPYDSDNNSLGQGDSGGSTGNLHGLYGWGIAGINSVTECDSIDSAGVCQKSTRFGSWYARPKYHYAWIMNTVGTCTVYNLGDGYALQCW